MSPALVCILGPTATGKSDFAVEVARRFGGEIVNADSMQVFRRLTVGTAAPAPEMLAAVPHHLFQFLEVDRAPNAGEWARLAAATIEDIVGRGRLPLVVGGTFFWVRALLDGLADIPPVSRGVREAVERELREYGVEAGWKRLAAADPASAALLKPSDRQRIARALEVLDSTGTPLSAFHRNDPRPAVRARALKLVLVLPRPLLYERIDRRAEAMVAAGLVEEVRAVLDAGFGPEVRPLAAGSFRPVVRHCLGEIGLDTMRELVARDHRNYAKRQMTWLRKERDCLFVDPRDVEGVMRLVEEFVARRQ